MARPKFAPKSTPFCGPIRKRRYLPHPWTRPSYDAKRHTDPIPHFNPNVTTLRSGLCYHKSVCLSVTLVHLTQGVEAFDNISSPLCTLATL